jgi:hypothetical protein
MSVPSYENYQKQCVEEKNIIAKQSEQTMLLVKIIQAEQNISAKRQEEMLSKLNRICMMNRCIITILISAVIFLLYVMYIKFDMKLALKSYKL